VKPDNRDDSSQRSAERGFGLMFCLSVSGAGLPFSLE